MQVAKSLSEMDAMVTKGQIVAAVDQFFADGAKTLDFDGTATANKAQAVQKLTGFVGAIQQVNGIHLHHAVANENVSMSEYTFDFDMKDGSHVLWHEVIRREWKDGKVVNEQYFKNENLFKMKISKSISILFFSLFLALGSLNAQTAQLKSNTDDSKIALQGFSPISYFDLNLAQRGSKAFQSEYQGLKYYFTDAGQKAKFDKNPSRYLPEYGGWCATGIAVGAHFRTDPNKFLVRNDKLYLFLYDVEVDALQLWLNDEKGMTGNANKNWKKMQL